MTANSLWSWSRSFAEPKETAAFEEVLVVGDVADADVTRGGSRGVSPQSRIEVTTPSGAVVRLYGGVDVAAFTSVMEALARC